MATEISAAPLGGSTDGLPISVSGTSISQATTIHTGPNQNSEVDELWIYANNPTASPVELIILWGSTATSDRIINRIPPGNGMYQMVPGLRLVGNSSTTRTVFAFTSSTNPDLLTILGERHRIK